MLESEKKSRIIVGIMIVILLIALVTAAFLKFQQSRFGLGTNIQSVNCSCLSVDDAYKKITNKISNKDIVFKFCNGNEYKALAKTFDIKLNSNDMLKQIFIEQKNPSSTNKPKEYYLNNGFVINIDSLKEYLGNLSELQDINMIDAQNASINFEKEKGCFILTPEIDGTRINFEEAVDYAKQKIKNGEYTIDFTEITKIKPKLIVENLASGVEELNTALKTTINFKLKDGSKYTLDANVMKNWLSKNEDGNYIFDINKNVSKFVDSLNKKVSKIKSNNVFKTNSDKEITIYISNEIDKEKQISDIKKKIMTSQVYECTPIYAEIKDSLKDYIELDISKQKVWLYKGGKVILTTSCVTGDVAGGHSTPTGVYYLTYKTTNVSLTGYNNDGSKYNSPVSYWMPFNGGIGFHDASWRSEFGGNIYKYNGSHGCVNLPYSAAKTLYQYINSSIPIIIYN